MRLSRTTLAMLGELGFVRVDPSSPASVKRYARRLTPGFMALFDAHLAKRSTRITLDVGMLWGWGPSPGGDGLSASVALLRFDAAASEDDLIGAIELTRELLPALRIWAASFERRALASHLPEPLVYRRMRRLAEREPERFGELVTSADDDPRFLADLERVFASADEPDMPIPTARMMFIGAREHGVTSAREFLDGPDS